MYSVNTTPHDKESVSESKRWEEPGSETENWVTISSGSRNKKEDEDLSDSLSEESSPKEELPNPKIKYAQPKLTILINSPVSTIKRTHVQNFTFEKIEVKALSVSGKAFGAEHLQAVASLPTRDEPLSKLLYVMRAPVEKLVRTIAEPKAKLVRTILAIKDAKSA